MPRTPVVQLVALIGVVAMLGCGESARRAASTPGASTTTAGASTTGAPAPAAPHRNGLLLPLTRPPGRPLSAPVRTPVPILMYHVISTPAPGTPNPGLWVTQALFTEQMRALRSAGYEAVTQQDVWNAWSGRSALPARPIVLSFDDGYLSQYTHAAPLLRRFRWPGVLNLKVGNIGPGGLTRRMVRSMIAAGWELDAHTITHPDLTKVDAVQLQREVTGSRAILRRDFKVPVAFFCYPSGRFDATVEAAVRAAGYLAATTTQPGLAAPGGDDLALPRIRVDAGESAGTLLAALRGASVTHPGPGGSGE